MAILEQAQDLTTLFDVISKRTSDNAHLFFQEIKLEIKMIPGTPRIITKFFQDNKDSSAEIDIVAVQGLAGQTCFTCTRTTKLAESFSTDSDTIYWVDDFRQWRLDFKGVRKLQFGYNGYTYMDRIVAPDSTIQFANALLDSLMLEKRTKEEMERPIIFVTGSLGGMVLKQALLISKGKWLFKYKGHRINTPHWHCSISNPTYGVISLGTPHAGYYFPDLYPLARLPHGLLTTYGHQISSLDDGMDSAQQWIKGWIYCLQHWEHGLQHYWYRLQHKKYCLHHAIYCLHHGWLAVSQIVLIAVMGNYKLVVRTHPTGKGEPESKMVGAQSAMLWPCSQVLRLLPSLGSQMVISPNPLPLRPKRN